jgi:eukaryotic-like serine/threonine-protein kinase
MEPERWAVVESLYHAALEHEPAEREAWLRQACGDDARLAAEVEDLLACADLALSNPGARSGVARLWNQIAGGCGTGTAETGAASTAQAGAALPADGIPRALPATIGRYRILRLLGEGGMGMVYEAEQELPKRTVALKVIKSGFGDRKLVQRFEHEALALGRLQHPGIAQIYEAGTAEYGFGPQPYFAMEFIRGETLLEYANAHRLGVPAKLELMAKISETVHHAHQRGIIHRDLKPGNILVDETGQPKILDFGVARATDSDACATLQTGLGQMVGTLAYMSPEQVLADPLELDTRSDVYALGVILYELLAGCLPYRIGPHLHEAIRIIREEEPTRLSAIRGAYRGDIETIVAKTLEKDKARRYPSAAELAADIRRYLQDEPITARPASAAYQLRKFARRHKAVVLAVAAVFIVLMGGIVVSTREAARANAESATARAISSFLQRDLLAQASAANQSRPNARPDPELKVRTALDRAAATIQGRFDRQPVVEAAIRATIGQTYMDLGLYPQAWTQLEHALDLQRRVLGAEHSDTLKTMSRLGYTASLQGDYPEAEALLSRALGIQRRVLGIDHPETLTTMDNLANVYLKQGKYAKAEGIDKQTLDIRRRVLGPDHSDTLQSRNNLANVYEKQAKYTQAEALDRETLDTRRRVLGPDHPDTLKSMNNLANVYAQEGDYAKAEALDSQALETKRRALGPEHPSTLTSMHNLAIVYYLEASYEQAEALQAQALAIQQHVLGPEHPDTQGSRDDLANNYLAEGKFPRAEPLHTENLEVRRRTLGPEHPMTLLSMQNLAGDYAAEGKYKEAEAMYSQALAIRRRVLGSEHPLTLTSMRGLTETYAAEGRYGQAEALLIECLDAERRVLRTEHPDFLGTLSTAAYLYQRQGKYALAESYAAQALDGRRHALEAQHPDIAISAADLALAYQSESKFAESEALAREATEFLRKRQPNDWQRYRAESVWGASLAGQKRFAEAEPLLLAGYHGMLVRKERIAAPDRYHLNRARQWLMQLYRARGKPAKSAILGAGELRQESGGAE